MARIAAAAAAANRSPILGQRFGRLLVKLAAGRNDSGHEWLSCVCDCGEEVKVLRVSLINGDTKSCGCLQAEVAKMKLSRIARARRRASGRPEDIPISSENKALRNLFADLSAKIKGLDNYTCGLCGVRGVKLHVHHIEPWAAAPTLRFDPLNLISLCKDCHINRVHGGNVHQLPNQAFTQILKRRTRSR